MHTIVNEKIDLIEPLMLFGPGHSTFITGRAGTLKAQSRSRMYTAALRHIGVKGFLFKLNLSWPK
jgi:hypothetical protein